MTPTIPQKARAAVIAEFGPEFVLKDDQPVAQPKDLAPGECLVKIDYAGANLARPLLWLWKTDL
jgi:propanol-preferring alcohol dehydrogenase